MIMSNGSIVITKDNVVFIGDDPDLEEFGKYCEYSEYLCKLWLDMDKQKRKSMDFFEAMKYMQAGTKVKLKSWSDDKYIGVKEQEVKVFGKRKTKYTAITSDESEVSPLIPFSVLVSSDWEISPED